MILLLYFLYMISFSVSVCHVCLYINNLLLGLVDSFPIRLIKPRANGRNIVGQQFPTLLDVTCRVRLYTLLRVVAQSLKPVKIFSQQLPTFLLFRDRRSVAQQCWIRLHSSSNIVVATHAHYAWFTKTYGLYPPHDALQVSNIVWSCGIRLHTTANTHATSRVVASVCAKPYMHVFLLLVSDLS